MTATSARILNRLTKAAKSIGYQQGCGTPAKDLMRFPESAEYEAAMASMISRIEKLEDQVNGFTSWLGEAGISRVG